MAVWNPWHGCHKYSSGCRNCYVYRRDSQFGKDSSIVTRTNSFDLPARRKKNGEYVLTEKDSPVYSCMTSDFFIEDADEWRQEIWKMISQRQDLHFMIITKRIVRVKECLPDDWGKGYYNVTFFCTCENQRAVDERLPVFLKLPCRHKCIILEPLLERVNISQYLQTHEIEEVICGGESGNAARVCDYEWVLSLREQCIAADTTFCFKQTGAKFCKDGKVYLIDRKYQHPQAKKAQIDFLSEHSQGKDIFVKLAKSEFRSRFTLDSNDIRYIDEKGKDAIRQHAYDFIRKRLAPPMPDNDGKQTPMRGHPVFKAQHGCACCCRGCLNKWYHIPKDRQLSEEEIEKIVDILMAWIHKHYISHINEQISF